MTWPRVQIRKVARLGTGHTPSRTVEAYWEPAECTVPWLTLADVWQLRDGSVSVVHETKEKISPLGLANSAAVRHPAGTVAFSRTASVGFSCTLGTEMATSQDFVTWTCGPKLEPRYLLWVLRAERDDILRRTQGSTHKTIYMPDIEQLTIPLPPLDAQLRIVQNLDREAARLDRVISAKRDFAVAAQQRLAALISQRLFSSEAAFGRLGRLVDLLPGNAFKSEDFLTSGGVPLLRGVNVAADGVRWDDIVYLDPDDARHHSRFELRDGDLVLGLDRPLVSSGLRVARVQPHDLPALVVQRVARLRPHQPADEDFVYFALRSDAFVAYFEPITTGVSVPHISPDQVRDFRVPLPSAHERAAIGAALRAASSTTDEVKRRVHAQLDLLQEHRRALVIEAIAGEPEAA
jgi:type I restriction enzyme S subunit